MPSIRWQSASSTGSTLTIEGSLGYFGCGLIDGPNIHIKGRVGWSCAENMLAGTVVIDKNAGSTFGAALRGGDLVCRGDVGARVGIDMKGGTIIIGGRAGAFCGFMMQRGRMVILGDAGKNLGDSMYDGTIYVGGKIDGLGVDAVPGEMTDLDVQWLERKLKHVWPRGAQRRQEHAKDRRRPAALELRQSRAGREEAHPLNATLEKGRQNMAKEKKAPAPATTTKKKLDRNTNSLGGELHVPAAGHR